jgi:hypothetical protein
MALRIIRFIVKRQSREIFVETNLENES